MWTLCGLLNFWFLLLVSQLKVWCVIGATPPLRAVVLILVFAINTTDNFFLNICSHLAAIFTWFPSLSFRGAQDPANTSKVRAAQNFKLILLRFFFLQDLGFLSNSHLGIPESQLLSPQHCGTVKCSRSLFGAMRERERERISQVSDTSYWLMAHY